MAPVRLTTDTTLSVDLQRSLDRRQQVEGIDAGETWGDFCAAMQRLGIGPETPLASIEYGISQLPTGRIVKAVDDYGCVEVREVGYGR